MLVSDIHYERAYHHNVWEGDAFDWLIRIVQRFRPSSLIALGDLGHAWLAADWKSLADLTAVSAIYGNHDNLEALRSAMNEDGSKVLADDGEMRMIGGMKVGFINGIISKKGKLKVKEGVPDSRPKISFQPLPSSPASTSWPPMPAPTCPNTVPATTHPRSSTFWIKF